MVLRLYGVWEFERDSETIRKYNVGKGERVCLEDRGRSQKILTGLPEENKMITFWAPVRDIRNS